MKRVLLAEHLAESFFSRYESQKVRWHYEHGLFLMGALQLAERLGDQAGINRVKDYYDVLVDPEGHIKTYCEEEYNLDQIHPGRNLFTLYDLFGDEKYLRAINFLVQQLRHHPRTKGGSFWHKKIYPWQVWLDGLYMAGPFIAQNAKHSGAAADCEAYTDIILQLLEIERHARDPETGLLYHAWDESRLQLWADPHTGCSPHLWGRAMGWYCMALVDILEYLPVELPGRADIVSVVRRTARSIMAYQDAETGLWYQVLDQKGRSGNYLESSSSAMFSYFLHKAYRLGYDTSEELEKAAVRGYRGLVQYKLQYDSNGNLHLTGTCSVAGLGGNPYRDGSYNYYINEPVVSDDFKGVGAFILASLELDHY
ncbi:MAG: glycoside hydrolase family 88 protein [Spirochaetia bacterium]|nr:glycoside hydrolase family 88 protein [Spirochaetia bacterium]